MKSTFHFSKVTDHYCMSLPVNKFLRNLTQNWNISVDVLRFQERLLSLHTNIPPRFSSSCQNTDGCKFFNALFSICFQSFESWSIRKLALCSESPISSRKKITSTALKLIQEGLVYFSTSSDFTHDTIVIRPGI